eukprot:1158435-Pelagomonas_calceolata.AAC.1
MHALTSAWAEPCAHRGSGRQQQDHVSTSHLVAVFCAHDLEGHSRARGKGWHKGLAPLDTAGLDGLAAQQEGIALRHKNVCTHVCIWMCVCICAGLDGLAAQQEGIAL